jgi:hypothetical protein
MSMRPVGGPVVRVVKRLGADQPSGGRLGGCELPTGEHEAGAGEVLECAQSQFLDLATFFLHPHALVPGKELSREHLTKRLRLIESQPRIARPKCDLRASDRLLRELEVDRRLRRQHEHHLPPALERACPERPTQLRQQRAQHVLWIRRGL